MINTVQNCDPPFPLNTSYSSIQVMVLVCNPEVQTLVKVKGGHGIVLTFSVPFIICNVYNL